MKIKSIYIKNFGNISNCTIKTDADFEIIKKDGDIDQLSLVSFISIMLYGASDSDRNSIRFRYEPINGMAMSGSLTIEAQGITYLIERTFSSNTAEDTLAVTDMTNDQEINFVTSDSPGFRLLGINKYDFERIIFITPLVISQDSRQSLCDVMSTMLVNFINTGDEKISSEKIKSKIELGSSSDRYDKLNSKIREKNLQISSLRSELNQARIEENRKLKEQHDCMALKKKYDLSCEAYEKIKTELNIQQLLTELANLKKSELTHDNFLDISQDYEKKCTEFHKLRADKNKDQFNSCKILFSGINENEDIKKSLQLSRKSVADEMNKYVPEDNAEILDTICEAKSQISDISYSVRQLQTQSNEKQQELIKMHDQIIDAKYRLKTAESEYSHFEEISNHRLLLAEEKLHNASELVNNEPVKISSNFILSVFLIIALALLMIVFLNNIIMVVIISLIILSAVSAIYARLIRSKNSKVARVNENNLRDAEREMRNIKNKYETEKDGHKYKVENEREKYSRLTDKEKMIQSDIDKLNKKILQTKENLNFYQKQKSLEEAKITPPDPRFFAFRDQLKKIDDSIKKCDSDISDLSENLLSEVKSLSSVRDISEAIEYMKTAVSLENDITDLNNKLLAYNNKDKSDSESFKLKLRIKAVEDKIIALNHNKPAQKISDGQLIELHNKANNNLNESIKTKDQYINAVTNLKLQYKDSPMVACSEKKLLSLQENLVELEKKQNINTIASKYFSESLDTFGKNHSDTLVQRISEIFSSLNPGKQIPEITSEDDLRMAPENIMKMPADSSQSSDKTLSSLYLAMRIAECELISGENESAAIIIDDSFIRQSDDSISDSRIKFFKNYSGKAQIIISSSDKTLTAKSSIQ